MRRSISAFEGQVSTWNSHALLAAVLPAVAVVGTGSLWMGQPVALLVFIAFLIRESRNRREHLEAGDWMTPEEGTGITPRIDQQGDLVGPFAVFCTWTFLNVALWLTGA